MATGLLRKALLALGCAGTFAASAATPLGDGWAADPDDQFLLDVNLRQHRLGDGVRAYATPGGTCIVFGDFLTTLDVPMKIDLAAKRASGWAFRENHRISIDVSAKSVTYGTSSETLAPGTVRETPEGWCVDSAALARWFGIAVKPLTSGSALILESEAKLPVEMAIEREKRAATLKKAKFDLTTLPQVRLPYRMWRAPALDFVVSAGVTYSAATGTRVDRRTSVYAAGEIARLSYDALAQTNDKGVPSALRLRAYRSDPEAGLLGPLRATHFGLGDVAGLDTRLSGTSTSGRGALITNRPLFNPLTFDRTRFEGDLPAGWEAELYRNGELLAFAKPSGTQRYVFDDVQLLYGENNISIILYGPQGQVRTRDELVNVGQDNVPKGKTWYWAGFNQPGRDLVAFRHSPDALTEPDAQAAVSLEHGLDERMSVGLLARAMLVDDERLTFVEGSVRRSIGTALVEVAAARDSGGGIAGRAQLVAKFGAVNASAEALVARDFHLRGQREQSIRDYKFALDAPLRLGRTTLPAHADIRLSERGDGSRALEAAARLSANIDRFNLAGDLRYRRQYLAHGPSPPGEVEAGLMGAGRVGQVRLRGALSALVAPQARFRYAELSAYWSATEKVDWEGALAYDAPSHRGRARITHVRRFDSMALALTAEAGTDGSLAAGINLNFSLDPRRGLNLSRQPLAGAGVVHARVYRDLNDNGLRDPAEPLEKGALITTGTRTTERPTDVHGAVLIGGLQTFTPITVGIDQTSLADPMLTPRNALQVVIPRPGVRAEVEIGLVGAGDIEGMVVKSGGLGFEGLDLELVGADGKVAARATSDFDGFFLFERVPYGKYRLRVAAAAATALGVVAELTANPAVDAEKSIVRLGTLEVRPLPQVADSQQ
ncbi:carboxypeptidase-like regulatory domain-containing protein [Sphingomonas sp.]|uniref:carboxypeptidase-like regulatory domain-containing protein n=1 Tax=Sphingomonas sp. TaxID=28214 RepID=UPI00286DAE2A|nr:carboxypeptidase-like regulatory domain-containing protein [Sphingomonas sp.]